MRRRDWISAGFAMAALAVAVLAIGGAMRWGQAIVAVLAAGALVPQLWSRSVGERVSPLVVLLGLAAAFTALQLVPLGGLVESLDPTAAGLRSDGLALVGLSVPTTITMDAPGTIRGLAFLLVLIGIALVGIRLATTERGRYYLLASIGAVCALTALIVGLHELFGATELYGLYRPQASPPVLGPLLNGNHLGGLMAIGTLVSVGLVMYRRQRPWLRAMWFATISACGVATVMTQSRGATLSLLVGALVCVGALVAQRFVGKEGSRRGRSAFMTRSLPITVIAACAVILVVYSSAGQLERQLDKTSLVDLQNPGSKFAAWRSAATLIGDSPWVGIGRGAFEPAFTRVHPAAGSVTFSHLENEYIQTVVDWGIPAAILLGLAAAWLVALAVRRWRDGPLAAGALGSLTAIAMQSNVDFGVELLGLAVPVTIIASTLAYVPLREASPRVRLRVRAVALAMAVALVGAAAVLLHPSTTPIHEDREDLRGPAPALPDAIASIERHPLDYFGYAVAAQVMLRGSDDARGIRLLNHAMTLHPSHPGLHQIAARVLFRGGHLDQAAIEYAAAVRAAPDPAKILAEIAMVFSTERAAAAIPADFPSLDTIVRELRELKHPEIAPHWLTRVLVLRPRSTRACELLYEITLKSGDLTAAEIAGRSCGQMMPDRPTRLALARVLAKKEGHAEVLRLLHDVDTWQGRITDTVNAWLLLCQAHAGRRDWNAAKRCLRRLDASGDVTPALRPEIASRIDEVEKSRVAEEVWTSRFSTMFGLTE